MTCDPRRLSYYRDGALSFEERYEVEDHVRECPECTAGLRGLMRLAQVVRSLPMEPVSPTLRQNVHQLVAEREQQRKQPVHLFSGLGRTLAPAAVAASIAVSALVVFRPGALELPSRPEPIAITAQAPVSQPAVQAPVSQPAAPSNVTVSAAGSAEATSNLPKTTPASGAARPSVHQPVVDNGAAGFPSRVANPTAAPEPIARFYNGSEQVRDLLGAPSPGSRTVTLLEQSFQGGLAIWRSDTREIYVLERGTNTWSVHPDTWRPGDRVAVDSAPPPGAMVPVAGFGTVWRSTPEMKSRLGWAVYEPRGSGGSIQTFEHGLIVWTPHGLIYVLSNDGRWRTYPDAMPL
jgi:anti-sigma factor RsiW